MNDISIKNNDLEIDSNKGDFKVGNSTNQEIEHIMKSNKGVWRQNPVVGVAFGKFLNGNFSSEFIKKQIKTGLNFDDIIVDDIIFDGKEIEILGNREKK